MTERYAFVIMIKEKWWNAFLRLNRAGKTNHAYVRRGSCAPIDGKLMFFYVVKPIGQIQGYAKFRERKLGEPDTMWKKYGHESCLQSEDQYYDLLKGAKKVSFIRFKALHEAANPVLLSDVLASVRLKRLPRGGFYINKEVAEILITIMG